MNEFVKLIISELKNALILALAAALLTAVIIFIIFIIYRIIYRQRKFPLARTVTAVLLIGYVAAVISITLLRGAGRGRGAYLHLLSGWKEAWYSCSMQNWRSLYLNVAMFIPLGVLLPLMFDIFKKWYFMLAAGAGASLLIEVSQYVTGRGLFDADDLLTNTLGAMLGYSFVTIFITIKLNGKSKLKAALVYSILPLAVIGLTAGTVLVYRFQPYGNLDLGAYFKVNVRNTDWRLSCDLDDEVKSVSVYKSEPYTKQSCDEFGKAFHERIGAKIEDVYYYDNMTMFAGHSSGHFLTVYYNDRSFQYSKSNYDAVPAETTCETLTELLEKSGISMPEYAEFGYEGDGWHYFKVSEHIEGNQMTDGALRCRYAENDIILNICSNMFTYEYCGDKTVISAKEAYEKIRAGNVSDSRLFEYYSPDEIEILTCSLEYMADSKGYMQPVYVFGISSDKEGYPDSITVPAI